MVIANGSVTYLHTYRGVADGGGGGVRGSGPPHFSKPRGSTPRNFDISVTFFLETISNSAFFNILKIKWLKSDEKLNIGGRWVSVPMSSTPPPPPHQ